MKLSVKLLSLKYRCLKDKIKIAKHVANKLFDRASINLRKSNVEKKSDCLLILKICF